ncbi:MAG: SOS response-associated peptidase [Solirubrobacteraceae bacterium]|nr:SOS response-associated peptidase [Solirubrobacteraceae bacterium]
MCGRYTTGTVRPSELDSRFGASGAADLAAALGRYNVAPSEAVAIVAADPSGADPTGRRATSARWGLLPPWARGLRERVRPINARAETLATTRTFAPLVASAEHRVLVVADGWYEWLRSEAAAGTAPGRRTGARPKVARTPFHHRVDGGEPFAMAGLVRTAWLERSTVPDDVVPATDRRDRVPVPTVAIVTCPANAVAARLHDRMPAILAGPDEEAAWLSDDTTADDVGALLVPLADDRVTVAAASPLVNDARAGRDGPELLDPEARAADDAPQLSLLPGDPAAP